jgi:integrase
MGSKVWEGIELDEGVEVRAKKRGGTVSIRFWYHKVQCRELALEATPANIKLASRKLAIVKEEIERNIFVYANHFPDSKRCRLFGGAVTNRTIGEALAARANLDSTVLEDSTWGGDQRTIKHRILPKWEKTPMRDVTLRSIKDWCVELFGEGLTVKTVSNILCPLRRIFDDAAMDGELKDNPFANLKLRKLAPKNAVSDYRPDPFDAVERTALLANSRGGRLVQLGNMLQTWWWCGLSASEIIAVKWSCIDWTTPHENGVGRIHVRAANVTGAFRERTKNKQRTRFVDMFPLAREALLAQKQHTFLAGADSFVFHNPNTDKPWKGSKELTERYNAFLALCKKAGVRYRGPNQCRHTYASLRIQGAPEQGIPRGNLWDIAKQLGHIKKNGEPNIEMLMEHYGALIRTIQADGTVKRAIDWSKIAV